MTMKKKLTEVPLPLEAINKAAAREKSICHCYRRTPHLWWARRSLAAAHAAIFALWDDVRLVDGDAHATPMGRHGGLAHA
ncbi:MAG TPA: DUF1156 domain-containing protein [Polyangiaceae bacterium]|nr:DUF1156 domain-containing protein [Polyangiaceae bacterium]